MRLKVNIGNSTFDHSTNFKSDLSLEISGAENCSFRQFLKICSDKDFNLLEEKYDKMTSYFSSSSFVAPLMVPKRELLSGLDRASFEIDNVLSDSENERYLRSWSLIHEFLESLQKAKVSDKDLSDLINLKSEGAARVLETFRPNSKGYARKTQYSTCGSVTGRLTVLSGPQILTAHHDVRKCLRSVYAEGGIYQIDFTSMEPRVALITSGIAASNDVYMDLSEAFPSLDRKVLKTSILTALYGGSIQKIAEIVGDLDLSAKLLETIEKKFGISSLSSSLSSQAELGVVRNIFGRPLREATQNSRVRLNHFLQSSAAEASLLLFKQFCESVGTEVRPLFVIHDALIVDAPKEHNKESLSKAFESVKFFGNSMPVKVDLLSHN